jgi:transketolase
MILNRLSRIDGLSVIARNSSFVLDTKSIDSSEIGRRLNSGYLIGGSVQREADRLRVAVQLVDSAAGTLVWSAHFDGSEVLGARSYGRALLAAANEDERIVALGADLTEPTETGLMQRDMPDRFFSIGIQEANMIGVAAGMARCGDMPFVHSFCVFVTRRVYDQVAMQFAYPRANVKIVSGPVYLRLPMVFGDTGKNLPLKSLDIGKGQILTEGNDVAILASGTMIAEALAARSLLANPGVSVTVANIHTVKPLDAELVDQLARTHRVLITAENHSIIGGLGAAVSERLALAPRPSWFGMVGLKDVFAEGGTSAYLMRKYEMDAAAIATKARMT